MYGFTANSTGLLTITMQSTSGQLDPVLRLYDESGRLRRVNDNAGRGTSDSRLRLRVREGQSYYLQVSTSNGQLGGYQLRFVADPIDDCGNTFVEARALRLNRRGIGRIGRRINYGQDVDVLAVTATQTGEMTVMMAPGGRNNTLQGELVAYDAQGSILTTQQADAGQAGSVSFSVTAGQMYYLSAGSVDDSLGRYVLTATIGDPAPQPEPDPAPEPDPDPPPDSVPQPAESIIAEVIHTAGGSILLVRGTDQAETITVSQSADSITLTTAAGTQTYAGQFECVAVYGFDGDDVIRLDHTVTADSEIYAGAGNDTVFEAGAGSALIEGGLGDDLLVTVGGGSDTVYGQEGVDSFWADSADVIADASGAELALGRVHQIGAFYQPYTTSPRSEDYVSLDIAGQELRDPATSYAYQSFADTPLFVDGPQYDDVAQGAVGDCYYLASLSSLALTDPAIIFEAIAPLGDGTFAVRFYQDGQEVYLRVDADLPVFSGGTPAYAKLGADGELWVPLMEKAYAYYRYGENSYVSISGGWMATVNAQVANCQSAYRWTGGSAASLFEYITTSLEAGRPITLGSYYSASSPIVPGHAYAVISTETAQEGNLVTVYNPWGQDGRVWDGNYWDGLLTISIEQVQDHFSAAVVAMV